MSGLLQWFLTAVLLYKYAAIFAITFLGAIALPLPAGAVVMASAFFATQGYLDAGSALFAGVAGTVSGDLAGYGFARIFGKPLLLKAGLGRLLRSPAVKALEMKIAKHPVSSVFFSRFTTTIAPAANLLMGLSPLPFATFIVFDVLGELGEVGMNYALGAIFGSRWQFLYQVVERFLIIILAAAVLLLAAFWRRLAARSASREA